MNFLKMLIKDWIIPIAIAIVITLLINKFLLFQVSVPTESMFPTIKPGDRIMVTKIYNFNHLKRNDIIVFDSKEKGKTLIKRLIGLPGETVEIKTDGSVFINGNKIDQSYVKYKQTGESYNFKVPEKSYFFMGDNRPNSDDARYWTNHYISKSYIRGKAQIIIYPFSRMGKLK